MKNQRNTRILLAAIAALGLSAPSAFAATYTLTPSGSTQDWNTPATWGVGSGTPGSGAGDTATLSVDFGGVAQTLNVSSTLANGLTALTVGDTNASPAGTTIGTSGGSLFLASNVYINSAGTVGAVNTITAPISQIGNLFFGTSTAVTTSAANNPLSITGKITPAGTVASRAIENSSMKTVTLGDVDITSGSTASVILTIRSGTTNAGTIGSNLVLNGTIADGGSVAGALTLGARSGPAVVSGAPGTNFSSIQINGTNTYTGATVLGIQSNVNTVFKINSDQPFGPPASSALTIGAGSAQNTLEAVTTDRTITKNSILINRPIAFQGTNSVTLAAPTKIDLSNSPGTGLSFFTNNITAAGKTVTIGSSGGAMNLNSANNTDLYRVKDFTGGGTTIIASNIVDNSGTVSVDSRMGLFMNGSGSLILTGSNTFQGGIRINGTGTVQLGNGGTTGSFVPSNSLTPIVNSTAAGTLALNRTDAYSTAITTNGPVGITQKGNGGSVTLSNTQFNSGNNAVGDGVNASKLVVNGAAVSQSSTTGATVATVTNSQLAVTTVTLTTGNTSNLKVGQPVYVTGTPSSLAYVESITNSSTFKVGGLQTSTTVGPLAAGSGLSLTFSAGSALGTGSTTVNNLSTLAGTGSIAGSVSVSSGGRLAPGVNTVDADSSGRGNFGVAATLSTGALTLTGAKLDFDLAATAAGTSDLLNAGSSAVSFSSLSFSFNALTAGTLEVGSSYRLISSSGSFTGDVGSISTTFVSGLSGYIPAYSVTNGSGLDVTFAAVPEPASAGLLVGAAALGGFLVRRRRKTQA
jgi:autotransporter-associated beta strand protein